MTDPPAVVLFEDTHVVAVFKPAGLPTQGPAGKGPTLEEAVGWIHAAGGQAVLAHPGRYRIDGRRMRELLGQFHDLGGDAIEVLSSCHTVEQFTEFARHARVFGLLASSGSDYHGPGESWVDLGGMPPLPAGVAPVWQDW